MEQNYSAIKAELLRDGRLFEDSQFPCSSRSIKKNGQVPSSLRWRRPWEISSKPAFVVDGATRFDLEQGRLGDCWFIAGAACLATSNRKLFERCVPLDQTFDSKDYAGIFRFNFWYFDRWTEVVVDDRLPTVNGRLEFGRNRDEPNEFWAALLEKAYAKLYGACYENIEGGFIGNALVDFTGGISEYINLRKTDTLPANLFDVMYNTMRMNSMMGSAIDPKEELEEELPGNLYSGHAYSITGLVQTKVNGKVVRLLRLRNPWGRKEWDGAWSDDSTEWKSMSEDLKKKVGLVRREDGEFWMSFEDWQERFEVMNFCHLAPDAITKEIAEDTERRQWNTTVFHGSWVRGFSAGGCGNSPHQDLFWTNPQLSVELKEVDDGDKDGKCTMVVSLMQKSEEYELDLYISFFLYKLKSGKPVLLEGENYTRDSLYLSKAPGSFINLREVTARYKLNPGLYVVIPTTYAANKEGNFLLRIYTEKKADATEGGGTTEIVTPVEPVDDPIKAAFKRHSLDNSYLDDREFLALLNEYFKTDDFEIESARSIMHMGDKNKSGFLSFEECKTILKELKAWKSAFVSYDKDGSGSIDSYELKKVFEAVGLKLGRSVMSSVVRRYGGRARKLKFVDFLHCCSKLVVLYGHFVKNSDSGITGKVTLTLDQWLETTMYY